MNNIIKINSVVKLKLSSKNNKFVYNYLDSNLKRSGKWVNMTNGHLTRMNAI